MNPQQIISSKISDPVIWEDFKAICDAKGVKMSFELENVLKEYIKNHKQEA